MKCRKKPVTVEAEQVWLNLCGPMPDGAWLASNPFGRVTMRRPTWAAKRRPMIETANGWVGVNPGDWIVRDPSSGDCWPVRQDIFEATYERIDEPPSGGSEK